MTKPVSFRDLINCTFGGRERFAEATGIAIGHVDVMKHRNSIAPEHWPLVVEAATRLSKEITLSELAEMRRKRRSAFRSSQHDSCPSVEASAHA